MTPTEYFTDNECITYTQEEMKEAVRKAQLEMIDTFKDMIVAAALSKDVVTIPLLMNMLNEI